MAKSKKQAFLLTEKNIGSRAVINWIDSHSTGEWRAVKTITELCHPLFCESAGWILAVGDDHVVIAGNISGSCDGEIHHADNCMTIPFVSIQKVRIISRKYIVSP